MRKVLIPLALAATLLASTAPASFAANRVDRYYTVMCTDAQGNEVQAESVDARAIEQGGKLQAIANFNENNPYGMYCWPEGPFTR
jgi:hypothetical protein